MLMYRRCRRMWECRWRKASTKGLSNPLGWQNRPGARVKKLAIVVLLVVVGCHRQVKVTTAPVADPNAPGAATPREAVQTFLATAKAQDIQAMSNIWGSKDGPIRNTQPADQLEQRSIYVMRCLRHDSYSILSETPAAGGERMFTVEVRRGSLIPRANFYATLGPRSRWFLREFQLEALNPLCTAK